ncbi:MAG: SDR family oxidoreductase, partial [Proteobacteria bacterium]|nr:SDR family oxidoreductase [Pseudomonadota bacterium]
VSLYGANVTEKEQVRTLFTEVEKDFGQVDGLINNAGITRDGLLAKYSDGEVKLMSTDDWQQVINVNLTGVFLCGREAAASMIRKKNGGVIINISSISKAGNYGQSNYVAAKSGVAAMVVTWAKELAKYNIRVCGIAPGFVNTEMVAAMPEKVLAKTIATVPLRRLAEPREIFHAAKFALENDYYSGRTLSLDGGLRI